MNVVDINVKADPSSCRELAQWLSQLTKAVREAADAAKKAYSSATSFWEGEAGEAFRSKVLKQMQDADEVADGIDRARSGLELFADDIDTVCQRMRNALEHAHEAGLTVTGTLIHRPPGDVSQQVGNGSPGGMTGLDPHRTEHAAAKAKLDAYDEIETTVHGERKRERTAHRSLSKALEGSNTLIDAVANATTWIGRGFVYAGTAHGKATTLAQNAESMKTFAENYRTLSANTALSAGAREKNLEALFANAGMEKRAADSNARLLGNLGKTRAGEFVMRRLSGTAGGERNTRANSIGRAFSGAAVVAATWTTATEVTEGKPIGKSVWTNFGALGVATGAGTAAEAAATAAGASGGPITATGLGVGFLASTAWSYFQENDLQDLYRDLDGDHIDNPNDKSDEYRKARYGW